MSAHHLGSEVAFEEVWGEELLGIGKPERANEGPSPSPPRSELRSREPHMQATFYHTSSLGPRPNMETIQSIHREGVLQAFRKQKAGKHASATNQTYTTTSPSQSPPSSPPGLSSGPSHSTLVKLAPASTATAAHARPTLPGSVPPPPPQPRPTQLPLSELKKDPKYRSLTRKWTSIICSVPIVIVTSWVLWGRCEYSLSFCAD